MSSAKSFYTDRETVLHNLNARSKLVLGLSILVAASVFTAPLWLFSIMIVVLVTLIFMGGWPNLKRLSIIILSIFVVGLVVWPFFVEARGNILFSIPFITFTEYELIHAFGRSCRIVVYILTGLLFLTVTAHEELVSGMRSLGIPYALCFAMGTALRLLPAFLTQANLVRQSQAARGHEINSKNPMRALRRYIPLLIPVLMTSLRDVRTGAMALEARGFDPRGQRTFYSRQQFEAADWISTGVGVLFIVISLFFRYYGYGTQ